ncbi:unnamed protein product [Thelazia callipaeda]|uniref:Cation_ATPase_N domain-containing protein n=1 Tax=Thelazia callipaeda TaxID=103827 RepID=A0A0N5DCB2_THECL|nr:unnamed protein product [Thelazia callipaeda]
MCKDGHECWNFVSNRWLDKPNEQEKQKQYCEDLGQSFVEHHLTVKQLEEVYVDSCINAHNPEHSDGLSEAEAKKRLLDGGTNIIEPPRKMNNFKLFLRQFLYRLWLLLLGAAALSLTTYVIHLMHGNNEPVNLYCTIILVESNLKMVPPMSCTVIRDSEQKQIPEAELVTGDLVVITAGAIVPADLRILQSNGLKIETSAITGCFAKYYCTVKFIHTIQKFHNLLAFILGEKEPYDYTHEAAATYVPVFEARNIAFKGSFCLEGYGIGIVVRTGRYTVI